MVKLSTRRLVSILLESERIAAAAILLPDGSVITGSTHSSAWDGALRGGDLDGFLAKPYSAYSSESEAWEEIHGVMEDSLDGFVTEEGEFVGREEALRIALLSGQTHATLDRAGLPELDAYALRASSNLDDLVEEAILLEATEPPGSYWISPSNQLIKVTGHYAIMHKKDLSEPDKASVDKVGKILGNGPLAEDFYLELEKAGWLRVVLCHQTESVYLHGHSRSAQKRVAKDLAVEHRYRLVDDSAGEKVLWSPEDAL